MKNGNESLRLLPSVDAILQTATAKKIAAEAGSKYAVESARTSLETLRREMQTKISDSEKFSAVREELLCEAESILAEIYRLEKRAGIQKIINATGVVVHTNLGRAPLSENARRAIFDNASHYCNLEYDLETGKRGKRGERAEKLLAEITGAEAGVIVNNCAAAAFLVLTVFASGGEVVISRGELVEIGGDFRVPDVLAQSGAILKEVGTTNRTKISDYEKAVGENTRMILRVHPSNYRIVGFTTTPTVGELAELSRDKNLVLFEDAGSGALIDFSEFGLRDEPLIQKSLADGADIVAFSGDKLLGGVQAGLIVGKKDLIEKIRKHPLYRALRVDKLIYAALEATFEAFRRETASDEIPVLQMLSASKDKLEERTAHFAEKLQKNLSPNTKLKFEIVKGNSVIGGGSAPDVHPETTLLALTHEKFSTGRLEEIFRRANPPLITRIADEKVIIDLRTVFSADESDVLRILSEV